MRSTDPARMTNEAILAELSELLAAGFQRHIASSMCPSADAANEQKPLAVSPDVEAPCGEPKETRP